MNGGGRLQSFGRESHIAGRRLIVTSMRNEAPFILEWVAYHRLIGFTDFLVFSNDCTDGTDAILDRLDEMGLITHLDNPREGKKTVQWQALSRAWQLPIVQEAEWIFVTDVDEFLVIRPGEGRLEDLFAARPDALGFVLSWRMFGNAGRDSYSPGMVMRQFVRAAPEALIWPWRAVQFKTLFRNGPWIKKLGVHIPRTDLEVLRKWVDDNGHPLHRMGGTLSVVTHPRYGLAQINHYALSSIENFLVKSDRGKPNHSGDSTGLDYWMDRNFNQVENTAILRHADAVEGEIANLQSDPVLARLIDDGITWRRQRISELMLESDAFYLYSRARQAPETHVLPMEQQVDMLRKLMRMRSNQSKK